MCNGTPITRHDLRTLRPKVYVNDVVINSYIQLLQHATGGSQPSHSLCTVFNTYFYSQLVRGSYCYANVQRWTKKIDLFQQHLIVIPVHLMLTQHWVVATINMKCKQIRLYDSLGGRGEQLLTNLLRYLSDELLHKHGQHLDGMAWQCCHAKDIPAQTNGVDCGVFTCKYIQHILTGRDFCWDQRHMAFFRQRMVLEILDQKIHWLHEEVGTQMPVSQMTSREDKEEASTQQYTHE